MNHITEINIDIYQKKTRNLTMWMVYKGSKTTQRMRDKSIEREKRKDVACLDEDPDDIVNRKQRRGTLNNGVKFFL
jgi:hypothetical protein